MNASPWVFGVIIASILSVPPASADVIRTSDVATVVDINGDGTFTYEYTVFNTSPAPQFVDLGEGVEEVWPTIVDFEVPISSPTIVQNVMSPFRWDFEIISAVDYAVRFGEPNLFGAPFVVHWFTFPSPERFPIVPTGYNDRFPIVEDQNYENFVNGFIFTSSLGPVPGPYLTSWLDEFRNIGDPPLPAGIVGGGGTPPFTPLQAPEPGTLLLMASALLGFHVLGRCASTKSESVSSRHTT